MHANPAPNNKWVHYEFSLVLLYTATAYLIQDNNAYLTTQHYIQGHWRLSYFKHNISKISTTQSGVYSIGSVGIAGLCSYEEFTKDSFQPIFTYERWQQKIK